MEADAFVGPQRTHAVPSPVNVNRVRLFSHNQYIGEPE
jgi:hypothetical protein